MWRSILAMVLLPSLVAAQTPAEEVIQQPTPQTNLSQPTPLATPRYQHYAVYDAIRQDAAEEVAIELWLGGFVTVPKSPVSGIVPLKLDLQPAEGLEVRKVDYPKPLSRKVRFQTQSISAAGPPTVIRLKLHADRNARLGAHVLNGKITFQAIHTDATLGPAQELQVQIPVTVVQHNASVHKASYPFSGPPVGLIVTLIILSPVLLALAIPVLVVCGVAEGGVCWD